MFIGHFAVGFAAKKAAPAVSLGSLFLACQHAGLAMVRQPAGGGLAVVIAIPVDDVAIEATETEARESEAMEGVA